MEEKPSDAPQNDSFKAYFERSRREKAAYAEKHPPTPEQPTAVSQVNRIGYGFTAAFAASIFLAFAVQGVNLLLLRDLPVYYLPFGTGGNLLAVALVGFLTGMVAVTSLKLQTRFFQALVALVIGLGVYGVYRSSQASLEFIFLVLYGAALIGLGVLLLVYGLLIRWVVNAQIVYFHKPFWYGLRLLPLLALAGSLVGMGWLMHYSTSEQLALHGMQATLQQTALARRSEDLPQAIQMMQGAPIDYAVGDYVIYLAGHELDSPENVTVYTVFSNSYTFSCDFTPAGRLLNCRSDWQPPNEGANG